MNFKTGLSSDGRRNVLVNLSPRFVTSREVSLPPLGIVIAGALGAQSVSLKKSATRFCIGKRYGHQQFKEYNAKSQVHAFAYRLSLNYSRQHTIKLS
jgi:hypothetical protein